MEFLRFRCFIYTLSIHCIISTIQCFAQGLGNGQDNSPGISGVVNSYTYLLQNANQCDTILYVADESSFKVEDLILIIQMQGATIDSINTPSYGMILDYNNAGNFEFTKVISVKANEIGLEYPLLRSYTLSGKVQVIKVPQYQSPTITGILTCPPWDGTTGGVLVIDALDTIIMQANINVIGKGFRGGEVLKGDHVMTILYDYVAESPDPTWYAKKGEGIAFYGIGSFTSARGAPANGGGGGNIHTTGGGGGSNFECGGNGGWGYPVDASGGEKLVYGLGGYPLSYSNADNKVFMGGGGGAGHEHFGNGTSGANGGGIVIIMCKAIKGNGYSIFARGNNSASGGAYGDGVGGAGGGGSVLLSVEDFSSKLYVDVYGGSGGSTIAMGFGPGGGGGGGLCWFSNTVTPDSVVVLLAGGVRGVAGGVFYGGSNGCDGGVLNNLLIHYNTTYPSVDANFSFSPSYITFNDLKFPKNNIVEFINLSTDQTSSLWSFGDGDSIWAQNPTHTYTLPGIYEVSLISVNEISCSDTTVKVIAIQLPNVFTPNGDGINDYFSFKNYIEDTYKIRFKIFNRFGNVIFQGDTNNLKWDGTYNGKEVTEGTYFYILEINNNSDSIFYIANRGTITLIR